MNATQLRTRAARAERVATRVVIGGAPYFGRRLADLLDGDGWEVGYLETRGWRADAALAALHAIRRADALYQVGGQVARWSRPDLLMMAIRPRIVMHWTGSDVLYARRIARRGQVSARLRAGCTHWAGAPWLVDELAPLGVRARWVPHSAVDAPATVPPLPETFTVLTYLRPGREAFYGSAAVLAVARALPEARVLVAGVERLDAAPANVRCLGWVEDMPSLYARAHVLLRMPAHDGLAFMVQEALAFGRHAVWRYPFPGSIQAAGEQDACARVAALFDRQVGGALGLNLEGAAHVRERFNPRRIRDDLRRGLAAAIEERR
jgi:hypothetical protein